MAARFFVDENDLALGRLLATDHDDVVYPGHPDLPEVPRGALDDEWLPIIGQLALVVITRDRRISYGTAEKRAWVEHKSAASCSPDGRAIARLFPSLCRSA